MGQRCRLFNGGRSRGKVTDLKGNKFSVYQHKVLATNGKIHDEMLGVINNTRELV